MAAFLSRRSFSFSCVVFIGEPDRASVSRASRGARPHARTHLLLFGGLDDFPRLDCRLLLLGLLEALDLGEYGLGVRVFHTVFSIDACTSVAT